ncbi:DNA recombination protein RmuC [Burkholderiaceae bacterium DAT-1]|nr:DNA recombination protein RmuC [Burkholderiaceae bacterium DAT-1]
MIESMFGIVTIVVLLAGIVILQRMGSLTAAMRLMADQQAQTMENQYRQMQNELRAGLERQMESMGRGFGEQGDRVRAAIGESGDRLRDSVGSSFDRLRESIAGELANTRNGLEALRHAHLESAQALQISISGALSTMQLAQTTALADNREAVVKQLGEISLAVQEKQDELRNEILQTVERLLREQGENNTAELRQALKRTSDQLTIAMGKLIKVVEARLDQIYGKVNERLDEGFRKTNETFASVMTRLATIDDAQRKIDNLASNVINLNELLDDKRTRGAIGTVQLEQLVSNMLPEGSFKLHTMLGNGVRADCLLRLPEPTGLVAVDAAFPLEAYQEYLAAGRTEAKREAAKRAFREAVRNHIDRIGDHLIVEGETSDGALMFLPSEAMFADIHAGHADLVRHAMEQKVWIVSPTTMMAVLNTARAVIKDVETRHQVNIIKSAIGKLSEDFRRFDQRMRNLADHIKQAHEDAQQVQMSSERISKHFGEIEHVRLVPGKVQIPELQAG